MLASDFSDGSSAQTQTYRIGHAHRPMESTNYFPLVLRSAKRVSKDEGPAARSGPSPFETAAAQPPQGEGKDRSSAAAAFRAQPCWFSTLPRLYRWFPDPRSAKARRKNIWPGIPSRSLPHCLGACCMIPRYTRPEMASIWEAQTRFSIWFEIEAHAADALAEIGVIPKEAAKTVWAKARGVTFDVNRIDEIERETKHDVIAFLTHLAEIVGPEARFVHQGMTSSDVLDTCLNVQLTRAADILIADIDRVLAALKKRAFEHKMTPTIGRSHGIHAEPVTFGLKLAYAYAEFDRARARLVAARKEVATCAISGAVGTFAQIDPRVEAHVAKAMGLTPEPVSTQVIPRDRHAMYFATLGVIASSVERLATEIRHLQRTEVLEAEEFFSEGQKGSSAMPHKRNPVLSENLTGLARM